MGQIFGETNEVVPGNPNWQEMEYIFFEILTTPLPPPPNRGRPEFLSAKISKLNLLQIDGNGETSIKCGFKITHKQNIYLKPLLK